MDIKKLQSICITAAGKKRCEVFAPLLVELMPKWGITTPQRESCGLWLGDDGRI